MRPRLYSCAMADVETFEDRFSELAERWRKDRGPYSVMRELALHPAYQQIIGLGMDAVPSILAELDRAPDWWFWALTSITREDPVDPSHHGKLRLMEVDWLRWARANGISW